MRSKVSDLNWEAHKFKSGLIMDVSKCPSCKKPRAMYLLRDIDESDGDNVEAYSEALKESGECCHPACGGIWGTGCWHCHSPEFFFQSLPKEGPECITDGCDNRGTVYRHCGEKSLVARCPDCDDVLIADAQESERSSIANDKEDIHEYIEHNQAAIEALTELLLDDVDSMGDNAQGNAKDCARGRIKTMSGILGGAFARLKILEDERRQIDTPIIEDFLEGVKREAAHQRGRWGHDHDAEKTHADWFWLLGYLGQKAMYSALLGDKDKAMHHTITTAAALYNWHDAIRREME